MLSRSRLLALLLTTGLTVSLGGCGDSDDWSRSRPTPTAFGSIAPGFLGAATPAPPESTVTPAAGSWDGVAPGADYRVVLLHHGTDDATATLVDAVRSWADEEGVSLKEIDPDADHEFIDGITEAIDLRPDLIISAGNALVDALAAITPTHLHQQFLVVGAELAEPTYNVTAADWDGASFRGEGLGASSTYDASTFTPERADRAVRAGVAAVLSGNTGIVVWID